MTIKLTLTIDNKVIVKAKRYAAGQQRSLSDLVENYLKSLTHPAPTTSVEELTPSVRALMGSFKAPSDFDYKKVLREERIRKHG